MLRPSVALCRRSDARAPARAHPHATHALAPVRREPRAAHIQAVKDQSTTGGQEVEEYGKFMKHVRDNAPQRLLVWGLGTIRACWRI